jgi:CDGSH-type Zn-finger protein
MTGKIVVTDQGPYEVSGQPAVRRKRPIRTAAGEPVAWQSDAPLATEGTYYLCRCGGSSNKPFCDGTHQTLEWDGTCSTPTAGYDEGAVTYTGDGVVMRDNRSLCQHAGFCATKTTNAWKLTKRTDDTAARTQLTAMVEHCPSGALTQRLDVAGPDVEPDLAVGIGVVDDGPLFVTGGMTVERADGEPLEARHRMTLCRCGASKNKPLCDGSHTEAGFTDR